MSLQDKLNGMSGPQLADFWNEICEKGGKARVTKFKDLETGRNRCYHLAWELGMLDGENGSKENQSQGNSGTEGAEGNDQGTSEQGATGTGEGDANAGSSSTNATGTGEAGASGRSSDLAQRLKLRAGTNKAKVAIRLAENVGGYVSQGDLVRAAYDGAKATKEYVGHLRMVLKGVKLAVSRYAPEYELRTEKGSIGLFAKDTVEK